MRPITIALTAALALPCGAAIAEQFSAVGTWTVTKVETDPAMAVTSVGTDDPAYMGARLTVAADHIGWDASATNGQGTYDDCTGPRFGAAGGGIAVTCHGTPWGPEATLAPVSRSQLRLAWYDGGILVLTRD